LSRGGNVKSHFTTALPACTRCLRDPSRSLCCLRGRCSCGRSRFSGWTRSRG